MRHLRLASLLCALAVIGLAGVAGAGSYDDAIDGNWNADLQDTWAAGIGMFPGAGDTAIIDSNIVTTNVDVDTGITLIDVQAGGNLRTVPTTNNQAGLTIQFSGGTLSNPYEWGNTLAADLSLAGDMTLTTRGDYSESTLSLPGVISGAGKFTYDARGAGGAGSRQGQPVSISNAANNYSGGTHLISGKLEVRAQDALGTGTAVVDAADYESYGGSGYYAGMVLFANQPSVPVIQVNSTGLLSLNADAAWDEHLTTPVQWNGGALSGGNLFHAYPGGTTYYDGAISLTDNSLIRTHQPVVINGAITESGGSYKLTKDHGGRTDLWLGDATLTNAANNYSGGTDVLHGTLNVNAAGALGTGTAMAMGGTLRTNVDDALASIPLAISDDAGTIDLNSTENNATLHIKLGGGFKVSGGSTVLNYTGTPIAGQCTVNVDAGAILDQNLGTMGGFPDIGDLQIGDGGFGVFVTATGGTWTVGKYSGTIYRGLAATQNVIFGGSVTEAAGGPPAPTEGLGMLATGPATLTYQNATFVSQGVNTIKFYGKGDHVISTGNSFNNDLEIRGTGMIRIADGSGISGRTLAVHGGYLDVEDASALNGATANIEAGGIFRVDQFIDAGAIHVKDGGGVWCDSLGNLAGPAGWDFQLGSQVAIDNYPPQSDPLPGPGKVNYILQTWDWWAARNYTGMVLSDDTRATMMPFADGTEPDAVSTGLSKDGGPLTLATGAESGRICSSDNANFWLYGQVDLTRPADDPGKLIIGDVNPFHAIRRGGRGMSWISQGGTVTLANQSGNPNVIGSIDVQAGTLQIGAYGVGDFQGAMGNAKTVRVAEGATVTTYYVSPLTLNTIFTGDGTVQPAGTLILAPSGTNAAGIAPGDSAGRLTVDGNLTLSGDGLTYATLDIEVVTDGGGTPQAKDDYDQVAVTGNLSVGGGDLAVTMNVPSVNYKPADLTGLEIATIGGTLDTTPFNAIAAGVFDSVSTIPSIRAAVAAHWTIEAADVTYDDAGGKIVLDASEWTGFAGDAGLDDVVDLGDLSVLAFNWENDTGMTWLTADFDLSGTVDLADLSMLAFHWEQSPPAGAPPVPEPMTVGLLVLGGVALLRRRRR